MIHEIVFADARHFAACMADKGLDLTHIGCADSIRYRQHLADRYTKTTPAHMFAVTRRLCAEGV